MKIYDKEVYNKQEEIRNIVIIIVAFLVGFFVGYIANTITHKEESNNINIINNLATDNIIDNNETTNI